MSTVMPEAISDRIIAEKIREWEERKKREKAQKDLREIKVHPFITISRDLGCREEEIIPHLETELGWKVYGRSLLDHIAKRENLSRNFIETLDEQRQNLVDNWVNYLIRSGAILQDDYVVLISKLIKVIIAQESAILLGRGANYILADKTEGLRIRLTAPQKNRIHNIAHLRHIAEKDADEVVQKTDREREEFIQHHFKQQARSPIAFDITFNTETLSPDIIVKTIIFMVEEKKKSH